MGIGSLRIFPFVTQTLLATMAALLKWWIITIWWKCNR